MTNVYCIIFFILVFIRHEPTLGQIRVPEKSNLNVFDPSRPIPSGTVISAIEENNLNIQITFREPDYYSIEFICADEKCIEDFLIPNRKHNISFRDLNNDFNNLRQFILDGFENTPSSPLILEVPDGVIVLTFKKAQYRTKVRIGHKSLSYDPRYKYFPQHYSDWLDRSQINYLFNR